MSYETKIDQMISGHMAEFQHELSLARQLEGYKSPPSISCGPEADRIPVKEGRNRCNWKAWAPSGWNEWKRLCSPKLKLRFRFEKSCI